MAKSPASGFSLLRAALLGTTALILLQPAIVLARVGVTSATDGAPMGKPPSEVERVLRIGVDVQANEVITTNASDRAHLVFLDGTSVTVGPNARLVIDKFVYDPSSKTGELAITASKGVFRLVGGKISKNNPVIINTPSSTIGIRGGITIFTVTEVQTTSTFVFGDKMTVTGQGQTQTATRPGTQVTTAVGQGPGVPTLAPPGSLGGTMGQLEGGGSGGQGGQGGPGGQGGQNAQNLSNNNSGQGPQRGNPPNPNGPNNSNQNQNQNTAINNTNQQQQQQQATTTTRATTKVIVTQGRFLADEINTAFNNVTLAAPRDSVNNQALRANGTATTRTTTMTQSGTSTSTSSTTVTLTRADGDNVVLPWIPGKTFEFTVAGVGGVRGTSRGIGIVAPNEEYFAYTLTDSQNKKYGIFGGTPTPTANFPTSGTASYTMYNLGDIGNLPFAPKDVGGDASIKFSATVSKLYSIYSAHLAAVPPSGLGNQYAASAQITISIAGVGAAQKSYMGGFIGTYFTDYNTNSIFNSGAYIGSYRLGATAPIGRAVSAIATADTPQGNAIYGSNGPDAMIYMNDRTITTVTGNAGTTTRDAQLAFQQPYDNLTGTPYFSLNAALKDNSTTLAPATSTTKTMQGFVGGIVDGIDGNSTITTRRVVGNGSPDNVTLSTNAFNNRAAATIVLDNFGQNGATATFELGATTGPQYATSAFINDNIYAMRDQVEDGARFSKVSLAGNDTPSTYAVTSRTLLASYGAAPVQQFFDQQGVTPCTCDFLSWGWWSGDVRYDLAGYRQGERDRLNLATYVTGTMTTVADLALQTGTATYNGHMVGNVRHGSNSYVAAGSYQNVWSFGNRTGVVTGSFDGLGISGNVGIVGNGPGFNGSGLGVSGLNGGSASASFNGAFFSKPGDPVAGQGGNFAIDGTRGPVSGNGPAVGYQAGGTFAAQKTSSTP